MNEYISQENIYYLWIVNGCGLVMIACAVFLWSRFIGRIRQRLLIALGLLAVGYALITFASGFIGLTTADSFGVLTFVRVIGNALMPNIVGVILLLIVFSSFSLAPEEKLIVLDAVELVAMSKAAREEARRIRASTQTALHSSK